MCIEAPQSTTNSRSSGLFQLGSDITIASTRTGQALRRTRLSLRVGQWSKATSDQRRKEHTMQDGKCRISCCPRIITKFWRKAIFPFRSAGLSKHLFESSKSTKWWKRHREADVIAPKIQKPYRNWDNQQAADNRLRDILEWLEFADNLEDADLVAFGNISREKKKSEPPRKVASGKHSIFTHIPKDRNCKVCNRTKITGAPCRKRSGEAPLRAERFGHVTTAW